AFMAGFYDPLKKEYTTDFRETRAVAKFSQDMNLALDRQLGRIGKQYIGVEISRADFNLFIHGDNRAIALIAEQYIANRLNLSLMKSDAGKNPAAKGFVINYNDIRDAVGLPSKLTVQKDTATAS